MPYLQYLIAVTVDHANDLIQFTGSITEIARYRDRLQPYLGAAPSAVDVNVRRLAAIVTDEIGAIRNPT
jgi:hypothetical protein